jgi:hypothetical protein
MIFCLPKNLVDSFTAKLKSGEIDPKKLTDMTSDERNKYFASFLGESNASKVNALFESKLLLKNQQLGIINWAKTVSGIKPSVKRDLLSRVEKMTQILQPKDMDSFLNDLANQRLGFGVTMEEAGKIADLSKSVADKKVLITQDSPVRSNERIDYGLSLAVFKEYVGQLKLEAKVKTIGEMNPWDWYEQISGVAKGLVASFDNSFFGRQGFKTLVEKPEIWWDAFGKSWGDIGKELKGIDAINIVKADVWSRPNALNGKYKDMGLDIGIGSEEKFPSTLPEKVPGLRRAYKASEAAYNGAALRLRADLADAWIRDAESLGVDIRNKDEGVGVLINSITGRGDLGPMPERWAKGINSAFFSIKFWKSTIDTVIAPFKTFPDLVRKMRGKELVPGKWARQKAAENTLKTIGILGSILTLAKLMDPESVELDPRSSKFGKIWVGKTHKIPVDVSLGMGSIFTLASRIVPTIHNSQRGRWIKGAKGKYYNWDKGKYGKMVGKDFVYNYITGKFAPLTAMVHSYFVARGFDNKPPTLGKALANATTPMGPKTMYDLAQDPEEADFILQVLLNAFSFIGAGNVNPPEKKGK